MAHGSLVGLAILKVNWDRDQRDYLECFVPLVADSVRTLSDDVISVAALKAEVMERFSIDIPIHALKAILPRLAKHQYVSRRDGIYHRDRARCASLNVESVQRDVERKFETTIARLSEFAKEKFSRDWGSDGAEAAFESFLRSDDERVLYAVYEREPLNVRPRGDVTDRYIIGAFVEHVQTADAALFEHIATLAKGNVLASALFVAADPGSLTQNFRGTQIYFDTPFLLAYLGYAGEERQEPCREVVDLLSATGAELCCFTPTVNEIQGILDACSHRMTAGRVHEDNGDVLEYFVGKGMSSSDVELASARLPEKLRAQGFHIHHLPEHQAEFQIDEVKLQGILEREIGYKNKNALHHDIDCLSAIATLRKGRESVEIERSVAVFVTSNVALGRCARELMKDEMRARATPLCVTDYVLGNLLWLKNPTHAPDLPVRRLIADAYASLQPSEDLWKRYLVEIARLKKEGSIQSMDYLLLRHNLSAKRALMELTTGDEYAFSEGTVAEVLQVAQEHVRADLRAELERERQKRAEDQVGATGRIEELGKRLGELETRLDQTAKQSAEFERRAERQDRNVRAREQRFAASAWKLAGVFLTVPRVALGAGLTIAGFYALLPQSIGLGEWSKLPLAAFCWILAILSTWSLFTGGDLRAALRRLQARISLWLLEGRWDMSPVESHRALRCHLDQHHLADAMPAESETSTRRSGQLPSA
jgi:hypothetical protein